MHTTITYRERERKRERERYPMSHRIQLAFNMKYDVHIVNLIIFYCITKPQLVQIGLGDSINRWVPLDLCYIENETI